MNDWLSPPSASAALDAVERHFRSMRALTTRELEILRTLGGQRERYLTGEELVVEGGQVHHPLVIRSGWACRQRELADGRRQILAFLLPGDPVGLCRRPRVELSTVVALTPLEVLDAQPIRDAIETGETPGLAEAADRIDEGETERMIDHVVRLGRQTAYERTAHLLLELLGRLEVVGLARNRRFPLPINQAVLADALGLSMVHVNRILQQLRRDQLIELRSGVVAILDLELLSAVAEFRPSRPPLTRAPSTSRPRGELATPTRMPVQTS
jgi:CRP-like cAMP-binding protein